MDRPPLSVVAIGECMLELCPEGSGWAMGYAGDVYNTAVYLARLGEEVTLVSALGDDPFSAAMRAAWEDEGLNTTLAPAVAGALPGLYAIHNDATGERFFHYWRDGSAVRRLFRLPEIDAILAQAAQARLLYLSGITLALFDADGRGRLAELARSVRAAGGIVAFDPNYRPALWPAPTLAKEALSAFRPLVTVALPTFDDEAALYGDEDPMATLARWHDAGVGEVVVKLGAAGCMLGDRTTIAPRRTSIAVDTTGAGDAFNAGYLAARQRGLDAAASAGVANLLAGSVIKYKGAIVPRATVPDLAHLVEMALAEAS